MKNRLLTKRAILSTIPLALLGCGDGANYEDADNYQNVQPVTIQGDLIVTLDEESGISAMDMLSGVTNPSDTALYAREFTYVNEIEDVDGNSTPNFEGPELPFSAIYQSVDGLFVNTSAWKELLVHPQTVQERNQLPENNDDDPENDTPMLYSQGIYQFTYIVDNGADELIERNAVVTINAIEDKVADIEVNHGDGFSIAKGYTVQMSTTITPLNATFQQLTYESSDDSIATISSTGLISGIDYGNVTFTVTSADGQVNNTISAVVEDLSGPLGVDIRLDGESISERTVRVEETLELQSVLLPDTVVFPNDVMWSVEPSGIIELDQITGTITALNYDAENSANNIATVTAYVTDNPDTKGILQVTTAPSSSLFYSVNGDFETGETTPWQNYWETPEGADALSITEDAAKDGMYGLHLVSDGSGHAGISLPAAKTPQDIGGGQGRTFKVTYDLKMNNFVDGGNHPLRFYFVAQGAWGDRIERWHAPVNTSDWVQVEVEFPENNWSEVANEGRFDLYFIKGNGAIDAYIDNIRLEVVEEDGDE